jgi:hypothetical protein
MMVDSAREGVVQKRISEGAARGLSIRRHEQTWTFVGPRRLRRARAGEYLAALSHSTVLLRAKLRP